LAAPCIGAKTDSFTWLKLRLFEGTMPPAGAIDLPLDVILSPVVDCFFEAMAVGEAF